MAMTTPAAARPTGPGGIPWTLWDLPAMPPPAGQASNFDNPETHDTELIVLNAVFLSVTLLAVALRFAARCNSKEAFGWNDLCCVIATLASAAHSGLMISNLHIGYGRHLWDIRAVNLTHSRVVRFSQLYTVYIIGICFAKLSVLLMYLRFFEVVDFTRHLIYFGIFLTLFTSAAFMGHGIAQAVVCTNVSAVTNKFCQAFSNVVVAQASANVVIDFYIIMIPLQQVYRLNMDLQRKLGLAAVFGIGLVACISSALRLGWSVRNIHEPDILWAAALISEMTIVEMNTVIIAPCLCLRVCCCKAHHQQNIRPSNIIDEQRTKNIIERLLFWSTSHGRTLRYTEP